MKKFNILFLAAVLSVVLTACSFGTKKDAVVIPTIPADEGGLAVGDADKYSMQDVSTHNTIDNCWLVINNGIYNASIYIQNNPSDQSLNSSCGQDASNSFGSGDEKAKKAAAQVVVDKLVRFYLGEVQN